MTAHGAPTSALRPGDPQRVGRYHLLSRLGAGGMGVVYLARCDDGQLVAVKLVHAHLAGDDEFRSRFRSEIARARQVPPFCTAEVLDADLDHEFPYLVVEYVDGPSLADVVEQRGPLSPANLHSVAIGVATALTAIHGAGVIHRDLKPRNVLLAPGSPKVIDFGIARALERTSAHTRTDHMVGTVAYMAPERFDSAPGTPLTPAADVFAWGVVVAFAGTGRTPFNGDSPPATAARILTQPPSLTGLPAPLRRLVELALAKDPADRPTARELLDMLLSEGTYSGPQLAEALQHQPALRTAASGAWDASGDSGTARRGPRPADAGPPAGGNRRDDRRPSRWRRAGIALAALMLLAGAGAVVADTYDFNPTALARAAGLGAPRPANDVVESPAAGPGSTGGPATGGPATGGPATGGPATGEATQPVRPTGRPGRVLMRDPLTEQGEWFESEIREERARCVFDGGLRASRRDRGVFTCAGPERSFPRDASVAVTTVLGSAEACSAIWLRWDGAAGYRVSICADGVQVGVEREGSTRVVRRIALQPSIDIGKPFDVRLEARGATVTIGLDGAEVGRVPLTEDDLGQGAVLLGIDVAAAAVRPYTVVFAEVEIRSLTS